MQTNEFDFQLPSELIAQKPSAARDHSRLMVMHRDTGALENRRFRDLVDYLQAGDLLVLNDSRVIPARLRAENAASRGGFEILLLEEREKNEWWAMMRPAKRARTGTRLLLREPDGNPGNVKAVVLATNQEGHRLLRFEGTQNILHEIQRLGEMPLPPYVSRAAGPSSPEDRERYQTVFSRPEGSVAAPTAGLHFTESFLDELRARAIQICFVTLHVGPGTFNPVKAETVEQHKMHAERFEVSRETAAAINEAKQKGRRIFAVGTTSLRVLESASAEPSDHGVASVASGSGKTDIFIYPPRRFKLADALLTNFHLPRSSLLMLAAAFAAPGELSGREMILSAYRQAIAEHYRFFSYGDAMLIL